MERNKILVILCIIFGIIALGFGGYFVYDKYIDNNDTEENDNKKSDNRPIVTEIDVTKDCNSDKSTERVCSKYLTLNNKNVDFEIITKPQEWYSDEDKGIDYEYQQIKINNKLVFSDYEDEITKLYVLGDLIVVIPSMYPSTFGGMHTVVIIDQNGTIVKDLSKVDVGDGFSLELDAYAGSYELKDNKLIITKTNIEVNCYSGKKECVQIFDDNNEFIIEVTSANYNEYADKIFMKKFEIQSLGNGKLSEVKVIEEKKLKDEYPATYFAK